MNLAALEALAGAVRPWAAGASPLSPKVSGGERSRAGRALRESRVDVMAARARAGLDPFTGAPAHARRALADLALELAPADLELRRLAARQDRAEGATSRRATGGRASHATTRRRRARSR